MEQQTRKNMRNIATLSQFENSWKSVPIYMVWWMFCVHIFDIGGWGWFYLYRSTEIFIAIILYLTFCWNKTSNSLVYWNRRPKQEDGKSVFSFGEKEKILFFIFFRCLFFFFLSLSCFFFSFLHSAFFSVGYAMCMECVWL
jgi:hypothetical protein